MTRKNRFGIEYYLRELGPVETLVKTEEHEVIFNASIQQMSEGWYRWMVQGNMVQDAFPFLSSSEREFLMTGITEKEWNRMFKSTESKGM